MKKLTLLLTALAVILSIAGCGAKKDDKAVEGGTIKIKMEEETPAKPEEVYIEETTAEPKEEFVEETTGSALTENSDVVPETTAEEKVYKEHTIEKGENLLYISKKYYGDSSMVKEIMKLNDIEDMGAIYEGQIIKLP